MKRNFKSLVAVIISALIMLSVFTGCTGGNEADSSAVSGGAGSVPLLGLLRVLCALDPFL